MPQMTLHAPDITCEHCIATIRATVDAVEGARFLDGDPDTQTFRIEVASGAVLDRVAEALAEAGYPLGDAQAASRTRMTPLRMAGLPIAVAELRYGQPPPAFKPQYVRVESTAAGADITYSCPCGSTTEVFHLDRSQADQAPDACCGHYTLVGANAAERLRARLGDAVQDYDIDVQTLTMPWGQPVEAVQAAPSSQER